ncbi:MULTISPECIES: hypothetical protein [Calothrix]|uniref:PepSY domain-containing protein n=3 Tax=Calothrix TaxID=1186 RepID=A0ABR8ABI9_9CYAN|nr:hypothetical protein [Calothrix anomala]MBD2197218.1 hypothetical protein [Calothrix parietina FACHB-288]MBD2225949.1 hypothetical protein [Calothrix anomala FACHB-343]
MNGISKLSHSMKTICHFPQNVIFSLALTSFICGIGLIDNYANAAPNVAHIQLAQTGQNNQNRLPKNVARAILKDAAKRVDLPVSELKITKATTKTFSNPCIFRFGEVCTREYRPVNGWEVIVQVKDQSWTYHANRSGSEVYLDPKSNQSITVPLPKAIANKILNDAAKRSGVAVGDLKISETTSISFGNRCTFNFGEICTADYNPVHGWRVIVQVKNEPWTYHVNRSGSQIILDPIIREWPKVTLTTAIGSKILDDAAKRSGVAVGDLKITQATAKNFGNPCEFGFGEVCTKEYNPVPGWEVIVQVKDKSWTYHVNRVGSQIILDPKINPSANVTLPRAIANNILNDAAKRSGVAVANLQITQATAKTFGNQCHFGFGEVCAEIYQPVEGWEVLVKVKEQSWTYHANKSGSAIVLDPKAV